ncbi:hypothetical protein R1flu_011943 [Riccia fluitans]|uniref:Coiled-coil SMC6 And NSE5 INteracting (CANIN) domain-containing protein n=1 Tax=Riccia fluitans TaxID=41844 RepID=A0ABD1Z9K9_9MARC
MKWIKQALARPVLVWQVIRKNWCSFWNDIMEDDDLSWLRVDDALTRVDILSSSKYSRNRSNHLTLDVLLKESKLKQQRRTRVSQKADDSSSSTDEEEDDNANKISHMITDLERESLRIDEKVTLHKWGEKVFYQQTPLETPIDLAEDCRQKNAELESSTEGLLLSGLLHASVITEGRCDERTVRRIFYQMVESPDELLETAACDFLCDLLMLQLADCKPICQFEWLPTFTDIMNVFRSYGYRRVSSVPITGRSCVSAEKSGSDPASDSDELEGPPANIRSFVAFLKSLFQTRHVHQTLSASEAAELVVILVHCQMDHCIEGLSSLFRSCMIVLAHYFSEEEWADKRLQIASCLSSLSTDLLNQVLVAESLHVGDVRLCALQKSVVILLLGKSVETDLEDEADILSLFKWQDMKRKDYDFLTLYLQLTLADLYLWSEPRLEKGGSVHEDWLEFMKRVTACVHGSDERPYATKTRNLASFLQQKYQH